MGGILGQPHPAVSSINVSSLLGASNVSSVLGGMTGSSILGHTWLYLHVETINVGGGGAAVSNSHIHMLAASLMPHQAPTFKVSIGKVSIGLVLRVQHVTRWMRLQWGRLV